MAESGCKEMQVLGWKLVGFQFEFREQQFLKILIRCLSLNDHLERELSSSYEALTSDDLKGCFVAVVLSSEMFHNKTY